MSTLQLFPRGADGRPSTLATSLAALFATVGTAGLLASGPARGAVAEHLDQARTEMLDESLSSRFGEPVQLAALADTVLGAQPQPGAGDVRAVIAVSQLDGNLIPGDLVALATIADGGVASVCPLTTPEWQSAIDRAAAGRPVYRTLSRCDPQGRWAADVQVGQEARSGSRTVVRPTGLHVLTGPANTPY